MSRGGVDADLRPPGAARERAPDDPGVRQHAPRRPSAWRATCRERLGEEHVTAHHGSLREGIAPRCRAAPEERAAARTGRHRLARARHRHRRRRARLPDRLAALASPPSCSASAAPGTAVGGMPKGRLFPALARRAASSAPRCCAAVRRGELDRLVMPAAAARRARAADRRRGRRARVGRGRAATASCAGAWPVPRAHARGVRRGACGCSPRASPRGAAGAGRSSTTTGSTHAASRAAAARA